VPVYQVFIECPAPVRPVLLAMPQGGHIGDKAHIRWIMQGVDALTSYAEQVEATLACYSAQTKAQKEQGGHGGGI
jgi:hypothetical protein